MARVQCMAKVIRGEQLTGDIYSLWLYAPQMAEEAVPGQFISIYTSDSGRLLPRPISICEIDRQEGMLRLVYRVVGNGTKEFSKKQADDMIKILGPLGNGFPLENDGEHVVLIGGGVGIPPLLELAKELLTEVTVVAGYKDSNTFLKEELNVAADHLIVATEDGSIGTKGNVMDAIRENNICADVIYACGPTPMLKSVKEWGEEQNARTWISMEEKMACGIGACLSCVCKSKEKDSHSNVNNKRICKDGPVFLASDIEL